ncbi:uncharacterized protein [Argopecten irradians]|uniref:uncharacterized protein isoform X2 n=1 Tax=Argopecten irradians TaxID=31199 RepID=UPI00371AE494
MLAKLIAVITIAMKIAPVSTVCPDSSWMVEKIVDLKQDFAGTRLCVKGFNTSKTWQEASDTCRKFQGNLLAFDKDYRRGARYYTLDFSEFWTGMYVTTDRFKVPLLDGVPPQRVNDTYNSRDPKTWQWVFGEPSMSQGCQKMTGGTGSHDASLINCSQRLPFYCSAPDLFPYRTSSCGNGSLSAGLCYTVYQRPMTHTEAIDLCRQEGGSLAVYDGLNKEILAGAVQNSGQSFWEAAVRSYYVNGSTVDIGLDGSGVGDINPINLCVTLNMGDAYIERLPCDTQIGVICEKPLLLPPPKDDDNPVLEISEDKYTQFETYVMMCSLNRKLDDFETMVIFHNSLPQYWDVVQSSETTTVSFQINGMVPDPIGIYRCEIQNERTSVRLVSDSIRYRYPQISSLIYRGYVNITRPPSDVIVALHNLQFLQDSRYLQNGFFITRELERVLNFGVNSVTVSDGPPLYFSPDFVNGVFVIDKIRDSGFSIEFSIYFKIMSSNDFPISENWYTAERDQFAMSKLKTGIETAIKFVPSKRRRKRQTQSIFSPEIVISSTGSCAAFDVYHLDLDRSVSFGSVPAGKTVFSNEICITDKRPLANVTCRKSFYNGASYGEITINRKCVFNSTNTSSSTTTLQRLSEANVTSTNTTDILEQTYNLTRVDDLTSVDVIYTASILTNVANSINQFDQTSVEYAADIVNTMIGLNSDILNQAQDSGSGTSRLVEALETISNNIILDQTRSASVVRPFVASEVREFSGGTNLVIGIQLKISPEVTITNDSLNILGNEEGLDVLATDAAIILPKSLLESNVTTRLLLQIYSSAKLFNSISSARRFETNSNVAAATLTQNQVKIENLGGKQVKTIFKPFKQQDGLVCGFWEYTKNDNSGGWSTEGCRLLKRDGDRSICVCDHLTNFAILIDFEGQGSYDEDHKLALSVISVIGLVLSIIGLSFTILCFIIFKSLRKTRGQKVLFQLAIAMLCSWVVFLAGIEQTSSYNGCIAVAILLHYLILVTFMWLLVEGFLQYLRFVKVLGTYIPKFMLKASICAWGLPLIPVIVVCAIDYRLYDGGIYYCWMSLQPFYYAFALPVGLVILINIVVFVLVIVNILRRPEGLHSNQSERKRAVMNFWAAFSIFVLLGITWIFGYLAIEDARIPFQYIFTLCNAFQGFFIFLLFITRDPHVRKQWKDLCCKPPAQKGSYEVSTKSKESSDLSKESHQTTPLTIQE